MDKPGDITSFSAASVLKRTYHTARVGHTGTLDPLATGVLPMLIGRATRLSSFILEGDKEYRATVKLGLTTDTLDITGTVLTTSPVSVTEEQVREVLTRFSGEIVQIPPMYSAIRIGGQRLYDLARQGIEIERASRRITVYELAMSDFTGDEFSLAVRCSKGTYIRTLVDDIGRELGCGAVMTALRRTEAAGFRIEDCGTPEQIQSDPARWLRPAEDAVPHLARVEVTASQAVRFYNGGSLMRARVTLPNETDTVFRVFFGKEFLGIGELDETGENLLVRCVISERILE